MDLQPGAVFASDYRILRPLSAGGMGAVYVVEQLSTGKQRALKLMHAQLTSDPAFRQRFEQEARIGSRIASEHVVEVHAAGVDRFTGQPYLVMELLEGEDLASRVRRGPLSVGEVALVMEQLCHALGAAHDAGVVHRDLKPENVFLGVPRRTGVSLTVKILDFGIAKIVEGQTRTTSAMGTPLWQAPEQTERSEVTPSTDVWALGLVAFQMLTGTIFWRSGEGPDASVTQLIREIVLDPIPPAAVRARERGRSVPSGFDAWFARCVVRDRKQRFPNAREAWAGLQPLLVRGNVAGPAQFAATQPFVAGDLPFTVPIPPQQSLGPTPAPTSHEPPPKPASSGRLSGCLFGALAAVLLMLIVGVGVTLLVVKRGRAQYSSVDPKTGQTVTLNRGYDGIAVTVTPPPSSAPTAVAPPAPTWQLTGMVLAENNSELQSDAQTQFNDALGRKLEACVTADPSAKPGSANFVAKVKADGSVASMMTLQASASPSTTCLSKSIEQSHFVATKKGGQVVFFFSWRKA